MSEHDTFGLDEYQADDATHGQGFVGVILEVVPTIIVPRSARTNRYPPEIGVLSVEPLEGQLRAGPAQIITASGRHFSITVLGSLVASRPDTTGLADRAQSRTPGNSIAGRESAVPSVDSLRVYVQGLEPGWSPAEEMRLEQTASLATTNDPSDPLDEARRRAARRWEVRYAALQVLATLGRNAPVEPLLRALDDDASRVRWLAAVTLSRLGARAPLEPFLSGIKDKRTENQGLRRAAPDVLAAHLDDDRVAGALEELLHDPNDGTVRAAAAWELGHLGARAPIALLLEALHDSLLGARLGVARTLAGHTEPLPPEVLDALAQGLNDPDRFVRTEMARALAARREQVSPDVQDLAEEILRQDEAFHADMAAREREIQAQFERTIEPDTPEGWLRALSNPEWETRVAAIRRLGTLGTEAPLAPLLAALEDEDGSVQVAAAETLATLGGQAPLEAAVADALFWLVSNSDDDPQFAAKEALTALAPWLPREPLVAHLGDVHWAAREAALEALIALGPDAPTDVLVAAVGDLSDNTRETALRALQQAHPGALSPLVEEACGILEGGPVGPVLRSLVYSLQAEDIGRRGLSSAQAIAELTELLWWPYWQVRLAAVEALAESGAELSPTTRNQLEALSHDPQSAAVCEAAQAALAPGG